MKSLYRVKAATGRYQAVVRWEEGGTRHRKYFEKASKAKAWAEARAIEARNSGLGVLGMTDELRVLAIQGQEACAPFGKTIADAVAVAVAIWKTEQDSVSVADAMASLLKARASASKAYRKDLAGRLGEFSDKFGARKISSLSAREVRQWLNALPVGAVSKNTVRRRLSVLFRHAMENEWLKVNPMPQIASLAENRSAIGILTADQARGLLAHAPARVVAHLAVALFCGLRRSEVERLEPASVNLESGLVAVTVTKTRGAARRFVRIRPNLRAWLNAYPLSALTAQPYRIGLETAIEGAGIDPWPDNALRHSFCSYALAAEKDINGIALEMGHTNPHTLFAHYRELVTPADAREYWSINPLDRVTGVTSVPCGSEVA